ncbi:MAG: sulfotransferase [Pseudomonadota bacterium]
MKKKLRGPNFFIIGAPKCGTTAMANFLNQHPEVYFSKPKEPMFFCQDLSPTKYKTFEKYLKSCFFGTNENHKAIGEGSPLILYSQEGIPKILDYYPTAKFIVMLRNPVKATVSMHGHNFKGMSQELSRELEQCWHYLPERWEQKKLPLNCEAPIAFQYDRLYNYFEHLNKLLQLVNKKNLHIILYDDFKKDSLKEYKKICGFLNISTKFEPEIKVVNKRSQINMKWYITFLHHLSHMTYNIRKKLKLTHTGLLNEIIKKNQIPLEKSELSPEFIAEMKQFFREDIIKTSKLINRDLSMWL